MTKPRRAVPCGSCRACCGHDAIILHPEDGDRPELYRTEPVTNPLTGKPALMIQKGADGNCTYLGASGCTIHDYAPVICREFDCRLLYMRVPRAERKAGIRAGFLDKAVFDAGRERLNTLPSKTDPPPKQDTPSPIVIHTPE